MEEPAAAVAAAERVRTLLPLPGDAMTAGAKVAVTPLGVPVSDSATAELNPLAPLVVSDTGIDPPGIRLTPLAPRATLSVGARTVKLRG